MPIFTQSEEATDSLLVQIDEDDLTSRSRSRISRFFNQDVVDYATLKANIGLDPQRRLNMAQEIRDDLRGFVPVLQWSGLPTFFRLLEICGLFWRHFQGARLGSGSVHTPRQLAFLINRLRAAPTASSLIQSQMVYVHDVDAAVQKVLDFQRLWANFHFPRPSRALW